MTSKGTGAHPRRAEDQNPQTRSQEDEQQLPALRYPGGGGGGRRGAWSGSAKAGLSFAGHACCSLFSSCCCCLGLCLSVVVPVAECADVIDGDAFAGLPLVNVCCFELRCLGAARAVSHDRGASVCVAGEAGVTDAWWYVGGAVVVPRHVPTPGVSRCWAAPPGGWSAWRGHCPGRWQASGLFKVVGPPRVRPNLIGWDSVLRSVGCGDGIS